MDRSKAEQFEQSLQRAARGERSQDLLLPLVETAQQVMALSATPPPAPHGLALGRQRFLAEAARLRAEESPRKPVWAGMMKMAAVMAMIALVFGVVLVAGSVSAASLPGQPLYSMKLAGEMIRVAVTNHPESKAALNRDLVQERLDEVVLLLEREQSIGHTVSTRAVQQLDAALKTSAELEAPVAAQALHRLAETIQLREQVIRGASGQPSEPSVQELLRAMERVRKEAQNGEADPEGLRHRLRMGIPSDPTDSPGGPKGSHTSVSPVTTPKGTVIGEGMGPTRTLEHTRQPGEPPVPGGSQGQTPGPGGAAGSPHPSHTPAPGIAPDQIPGPVESPQPSGTPNPPGSPAPRPVESPQPSGTPNPSDTPGPGNSPSPSRTPSKTHSVTVTPQPTGSPYASRTPGPGDSPSPTSAPGHTPSVSVTPQSTASPYLSRTPGPGNSPTPTSTTAHTPHTTATPPQPAGTPTPGGGPDSTPGNGGTPGPGGR